MEYILDEKSKFNSNRTKPIKYIINNTCWECTSHAKYSDGYPRIKRNNKEYGMHRYSYLLHKGEIPEGFVIMHLCDNPSCINPEHLKAGTQQDNLKDRDNKGRNTKGMKWTNKKKE